MWQVRIWINARTPELVNGSPVNLGWQIKGVIKPVIYISETASELIYDLICHCKGKKRCQRNCPCYISNLLCIKLCVCVKVMNKFAIIPIPLILMNLHQI